MERGEELLGGMMEDTEEGNGGQRGSRRERNIEEDREGGEMEGDREGWRGKREGEEMMRKEKIKKKGKIRRRGIGWQRGEVWRMSGAPIKRDGERGRGKVEWIIGKKGRWGDDKERKEMKER